jgi:hypothetical protein
MEEEGKRKDRDFEEVVKSSQPKFLEIVKETYYLAVLGSLCIAISAFTQQNYPQVQTYAITGASLFLIAFFCSFIAKIIPSSYVIIVSYLSTGAGVLMLFLVTMEFGSAFPLVSKVFTALYIGVVLTIFAAIPYNLFRYRRKSKGKSKICVTASVVFLTITIPFLAITMITVIFVVVTTLEIIFLLATVIIGITSFIIGVAFLLVAIPLMYKEGKLRRKEEKMYLVYMDEGSGL